MFYVIVNLSVSKNENISYHYTHKIKSVNITQPLHVYFFPRMFMSKKRIGVMTVITPHLIFKQIFVGRQHVVWKANRCADKFQSVPFIYMYLCRQMFDIHRFVYVFCLLKKKICFLKIVYVYEKENVLYDGIN